MGLATGFEPSILEAVATISKAAHELLSKLLTSLDEDIAAAAHEVVAMVDHGTRTSARMIKKLAA
jgi:hypothetical protein